MRAPNGSYPGEYQIGQGKRDVRYVATGDYRSPRKGDYYLSGAVIAAYRAHHDMDGMKYWIAVPVNMVGCTCCKGAGRVIGAVLQEPTKPTVWHERAIDEIGQTK